MDLQKQIVVAVNAPASSYFSKKQTPKKAAAAMTNADSLAASSATPGNAASKATDFFLSLAAPVQGARAKRKWKDDLSFHIQHAEFAKEKKNGDRYRSSINW